MHMASMCQYAGPAAAKGIALGEGKGIPRMKSRLCISVIGAGGPWATPPLPAPLPVQNGRNRRLIPARRQDKEGMGGILILSRNIYFYFNAMGLAMNHGTIGPRDAARPGPPIGRAPAYDGNKDFHHDRCDDL
jgi:hypothetical protein